MWPRQASVLACVVLAGTSEGLAGQKFLRELVLGVAALNNLGSILVEILHSIEGGDVEQVCSNLETLLPYLRLLISLSHLCFISCMFILFISLYA